MAFTVGAENQTTGVQSEFWLKPDGGTLTKVGLNLSIPELPTGVRPLLKTTHMETGDFETYMAGPRKDGTELTITFQWVAGDDGDDVCQQAFDDALEVEYRIVTRKHDLTWQKRDGTCIVTGYKIMNPAEEIRTAEVTIKFTSAPVTAAYTHP